MFRKRRIKKEYPPGTFIPTTPRIMAILQLCIAFTMILWYVSEPFVGEIFNIKSRLLLYQDVIGIKPATLLPEESLNRLSRNANRFQALPLEKQQELTNQMYKVQNELKKPFSEKITEVFKIFAFKLSHYEVLWLLFSIIIPIMLLKKIDGATEAVWILPLLVALYAFESYQHPYSQSSKEAALFPTEQELLKGSLENPIEMNIFEKQKQLTIAWKRYLAIHWANTLPSNDLELLEAEAEVGEHAFNIERLKLRKLDETALKSNSRKRFESLALIVVYLIWNLIFAFISTKYCRKTTKTNLSIG